jgi:hypothetical protein
MPIRLIVNYLMDPKMECEEKGGIWVEQDGAWMCKHPEESAETAEAPALSAEEEAM